MPQVDKPVILFDGVCNLCTASVQFVIKRDKEKRFLFSSLQSTFGQQILKQFNLASNNFNTVILYQDGKIYTKSTGLLKVLSKLIGWKWTRIFFAVPRFIRDWQYNIFARNRYRWFGKKDECMVPTPEMKSRFIE